MLGLNKERFAYTRNRFRCVFHCRQGTFLSPTLSVYLFNNAFRLFRYTMKLQ